MILPVDLPIMAAENIPIAHQICDHVLGDVYLLDPANKIAHRHRIPPQLRILPRKDRPPEPPDAVQYTWKSEKAFVERLGKRKIEGVWVEGTRAKTTYSATATSIGEPLVVITEYWSSADLGLLLLWKRNDSRRGDTIRAIKDISRIEPDPKLFQVPSDYTVVDETGPFTISFGSP
jgi:hypothetical protein